MNDLANEPVEEAVEADSRETTSAVETVVPTKEEMEALCANIQTSYNLAVDVKPVTFNFKTSVEKNAAGEVISETKRPSLELPIPYPSIQGIIDILEQGGTDEGKKSLELLMAAVEAVITQNARSIISDDPTLTATNLPVEKLSWDFIANMPKAERSGGGIAKEVWDDFATDYIAVMVEATGNEVDKVSRAAGLLKSKLANCKTNIPVLNRLVELLGVYIGATKRATEFEPCVSFLVDKADKLVNTTPEELLEAL